MLRFLCLLALCLGQASAQNNAGVFGPKVNEGRKVFEYRYAVAEPLENAPDDRWSQRAHYEHAFGDRFMGRIGVQWRDNASMDQAEFQFLRGMLFMELGEVTDRWTTGLRFDARVRNGDGPDDLALSWTNQYDLGPQTFARFVVMSFYQFGDLAADNPVIETRSTVVHRFKSGPGLGLELYNTFGEIGAFGDFDDQRHEISPVITVPLGGGYSLFTGIGLGLSEPVADNSFRMRLIRNF